jgi:hypothetical protein
MYCQGELMASITPFLSGGGEEVRLSKVRLVSSRGLVVQSTQLEVREAVPPLLVKHGLPEGCDYVWF